jgi:hypothetical protein
MVEAPVTGKPLFSGSVLSLLFSTFGLQNKTQPNSTTLSEFVSQQKIIMKEEIYLCIHHHHDLGLGKKTTRTAHIMLVCKVKLLAQILYLDFQ